MEHFQPRIIIVVKLLPLQLKFHFRFCILHNFSEYLKLRLYNILKLRYVYYVGNELIRLFLLTKVLLVLFDNFCHQILLCLFSLLSTFSFSLLINVARYKKRG